MGWSSTRSTRNFRSRGLFIIPTARWNSAGNDSAAAGLRLNQKLAVHQISAIAHDADSKTVALRSLYRETNAIVRNAQVGNTGIRTEMNVDLPCLAMFSSVVNRFLGDAVEVGRVTVLPDFARTGRFEIAFQGRGLTGRGSELLQCSG